MHNRLGIGSWTYPWAIGVAGYPPPVRPFSALTLLEKAEELGVGVVQYCGNLPLHQLPTARRQELKERAEEAGIKIEVGTRGLELANLRSYLEIARELEAGLLRTVITGESQDFSLEQAAELLRDLVPELEEAGVCLGIENHEKHPAAELAELVRRVDSSSVGICLDTVNSFGALETPEMVIAELAPFVINLHFKDFVIERVDHQMGMTIRGCPAGQGRLELEWLEGIIKERPEISIILEQWPPFIDSMEKTVAMEAGWAEEGIAYLKQSLQGLQSSN